MKWWSVVLILLALAFGVVIALLTHDLMTRPAPVVEVRTDTVIVSKTDTVRLPPDTVVIAGEPWCYDPPDGVTCDVFWGER